MLERITAPTFVVSLVGEWLMHYDQERQYSNPLWYPSATVEARILESPMAAQGRGIARSKVPLDQLPGRLVPVDRAMKSMPEGMRLAVIYRHLGDFPGFAAETGFGKSRFYTLADQGYWYIAGVLNAELDR